MASFSPIRALIVFIAIALALGTLAARAAWLSAYPDPRIEQLADRQHHRTIRIQARRGSIYDRNLMLMAGTVKTNTVFIDPKFMLQQHQTGERSLVDMDIALAKLGRLIDRDQLELAQIVAARAHRRYHVIAEHLSDQAADQVRALKIPGVGVLAADQRHYPMGGVAAHILGGVRKDQVGLAGVELQFQQMLAGRDGRKRSLTDTQGRELSVDPVDYLAARHGEHLVLTIDANIQIIAEQELAAACRKFKAPSGEVVVMDPRTGEVLALACYPTFTPQNPQDSPIESRRNRALTDPYEPGSTLKPFLVGPALEWGITTPEYLWPIKPGVLRTSYGRRVSDAYDYGRPLNTWDVLVKSSNKGMCLLAARMKQPRMYDALSRFGFGKKPGIEMPGDHQGSLRPLNKWERADTESMAQGYAIMVTPLQLARAFSVYANGGKLVKPTLVRGRLDAEGRVVVERPVESKQVLAPEAANTIKRILTDVPVRGTARAIELGEHALFGKTGTAHIAQPNGRYDRIHYNSSIVLGGPVENPRLVTAFVVHEPLVIRDDPSFKPVYGGGAVAGPSAGRLMNRALAYLQAPPSPKLDPAPEDVWKNLYSPHSYRSRRHHVYKSADWTSRR